VIETTGLAMIILAALIYFLDILQKRGKWSQIGEAFGKNPLFIYVLSLFLPKLGTLIRIPYGEKFLTPFQWFYENVCAKIPGDPKNGSLVYSLIFVCFYAVIVMYLNRKKIYIRV
jgi:predicted acyltransferase